MESRAGVLLFLGLIAAAVTPGHAAADPFSFDGDTIHAELSSYAHDSLGGSVVVSQFASSSVVGAGPEFTGVIGDPYFEPGPFLWDVTVDITGRELAVSVVGAPGACMCVGWDLTITDLNFTAPEAAQQISYVLDLSPTPDVGVTASHTADSVTIHFLAIQNFSPHFLITSSLPEPALPLLWAIGIALAAGARVRSGRVSDVHRR